MMRRHYIVATLLACSFVILIWAQFFFTQDIRHDQQTIDDFLVIEESIRHELRNTDLNTGDSPRAPGSINLDDEVDIDRLPGLYELDLGSDLLERAEERNYELSYTDVARQGRVDIELCGEFRSESSSGSAIQGSFDYHEPGLNCFDRAIYFY